MKNDVVAKTIETYEAIANDFFNEHFDIAERKPDIDMFLKYLKGTRIFDIGCGPGRDSKYFSAHGLDVVGIDATPNFVKLASKNAPRAKFIKQDMRKLDFPENSFDGIWACASFLHIPKSEAKDTLLGFWRVLKPNGLMYLSVKQGTEEKFMEKDEYRGRTTFFAFYAEKEILDLIESCGFKVTKSFIVEKRDTWINVFAVKN